MSKNNHGLADKITNIPRGRVADITGVDRFALAMKKKLAKKRTEGRSGWNTTPALGWGCNVRELESMLRQHLEKGDVVDIANFCMMVWNRRNPKGSPR